jgi:hypothetical protein
VSIKATYREECMKGPEFFEKQEIDAFLKKLGPEVVWWHKTFSGGYGKSGVGDYLLCLNGAFWNVEVKRPGKGPTAIQTRRMNEVRSAGGHAVAGTAEAVIQVLTDWLAVRGIRT